MTDGEDERTRLVKQREYDLEEDINDQCDSFEIGISSASTASDSSSVEAQKSSSA